MAQVPLREHYDSDEEYQIELDIYLTNLDSDVENMSSTMGTASTGMDDEAYPTVGGLRVGYQERYLHTRYGTSSTGADFTNDYTTISGLTVFQGLRNSDSPTESTNPAEYTWREINVLAGWSPNYRIAGGRLVDWNFGAATPTNYVVDNIAGAIDLDNFASGATGPKGEDAIQIEVVIRETNTISTDPDTWAISDEGQFFRNDQGDTKYLVATAIIGGVRQSMASHTGYTFAWQKNGAGFTPSSGNAMSRFVVVVPADIQNGGADQFACVVNTTP